MSFLRMRRKFAGATAAPGVGALQSQSRLITVNGTIAQPGGAVGRLPFSDGFESGNTTAWDTTFGTVTVTTAEHYVGSRSSMTTATLGQASDHYLEYNFGDALSVGGVPTGVNDLWIQFAHKWASNYTDSDTGIISQKLAILNIHNPSSGARRYQLVFNIFNASNQYYFEFFRWLETGGFNGSATANIGIDFTRVKGRWEEFVWRVRMNTPGSSDGHLDVWTKAEGETIYTQKLNRTNINYRENTTFSPNRLIQSNFNSETTRSGQRFWDAWYIGQDPVDIDVGTAGNDGQVGSYDNMNLATYPIYSVDMAQNDYDSHFTGGAAAPNGTTTHFPTGWWDGGAFARMTTPNDDLERGINVQEIWRSGSVPITDFCLRYETRWPTNMASNIYQTSGGAKHSLLHCFSSLTASHPDWNARQVFFLQPCNQADSAANNRANTLCYAPGCNTWPGYGAAVYDDRSIFDGGTLTFYQNSAQAFYIADGTDAATTFLGKPILKCGDFWTIEYRIISQPTAAYPRGLIAFRWTTRTGLVFERGIPFNYDTGFPFGYLMHVQQFGCGQWNNAPTPSPTSYFDVGGYFTISRSGGWLGPRTGFVV